MNVGEADLKLPKLRASIQVALHDGNTRQMAVFIAEHRAHDWRPQQVLDLFEDDAAFLPAFDESDQAWMLVNKDLILWIALPTSRAASEEDEPLFEHRHEVTIELTGGHRLQGQLLYSAPTGNTRVVDYLNSRGVFLRLWSPEQTYLVRKKFVIRVLEKPLGKKAG